MRVQASRCAFKDPNIKGDAKRVRSWPETWSWPRPALCPEQKGIRAYQGQVSPSREARPPAVIAAGRPGLDTAQRCATPRSPSPSGAESLADSHSQMQQDLRKANCSSGSSAQAATRQPRLGGLRGVPGCLASRGLAQALQQPWQSQRATCRGVWSFVRVRPWATGLLRPSAPVAGGPSGLGGASADELSQRQSSAHPSALNRVSDNEASGTKPLTTTTAALDSLDVTCWHWLKWLKHLKLNRHRLALDSLRAFLKART